MADLATNVVLKIVVLTFNRICTTPVLKHDFKNLKYEAENISNNNISGHYLLKAYSVLGTVLTTFQGLSHLIQ